MYPRFNPSIHIKIQIFQQKKKKNEVKNLNKNETFQTNEKGGYFLTFCIILSYIRSVLVQNLLLSTIKLLITIKYYFKSLITIKNYY